MSRMSDWSLQIDEHLEAAFRLAAFAGASKQETRDELTHRLAELSEMESMA